MPAHNGTDTPIDIQVGPPPPQMNYSAPYLLSLGAAALGPIVMLIACLSAMSMPALVIGFVLTLLGLAGLPAMSRIPSKQPIRCCGPS